MRTFPVPIVDVAGMLVAPIYWSHDSYRSGTNYIACSLVDGMHDHTVKLAILVRKFVQVSEE